MKTKKINMFLVFLFSFNLYCQNFSLNGGYIFTVYSGLYGINLTDGKLIYDFMEEGKNDLAVSYKIIHLDGMTFIKMDERVPREVTYEYKFHNNKTIETDDKFLILVGKDIGLDRIILLATTKGFSKNYPCTETIISQKVQVYKDCSSFLKEKNKDYPVTNLDTLTVDTPWVEAVPGPGIGEGFTLVNSWGKIYSHILLINGYISYEKPYLYKQNNRIKKIKVTGLKSGKSQILDVLDTPHPQTVDISFITEAEDLRVEIADIYKGTKYDDTCLHYMITYNSEVIPYEDSIQ